MPGASLEDAIDAVLPQTQCRRCGEPDCRGYARAVAAGAPIDRCPPGGAEGVARLAAVTGRPTVPLDAAFGVEAPRAVAVIDENWCIGCTLCLPACPVDAIAGALKRMHTVIVPHCTGCALCVPACPVDCIAMRDASAPATGWAAWSAAQADDGRRRHVRHLARGDRLAGDQAARREARAIAAGVAPVAPFGQTTGADAAARRARIDAALARAKARRGGGSGSDGVDG